MRRQRHPVPHLQSLNQLRVTPAALRAGVQGAGLGLRRAHLEALFNTRPSAIDFFEIAPENWMRVGGRLGRFFRGLTESYPFCCHGLCLSLGAGDPLDYGFLHELKRFMDEHGIQFYSEHLSYSSGNGHLYDLMPIPFTSEAVQYVSGRIQKTQEVLERRIAIENISYYAAPGQEMSEIDFINAVLLEADCELLLDVNNVFVNSVNHGYDAKHFLEQVPFDRVSSIHVAGHYHESETLLIDTHGAPVKDSVWDLLGSVYDCAGVLPTVLERDFNLPPLEALLLELDQVKQIQLGKRAGTQVCNA